MIQRELQRDIAPEGRAHEDRISQFQRLAERVDELHVVICGELVLFLPPFAIVRRVGFAVARQIIGDHIIVFRYLGILQQIAPLVIVTSRRMLTDKRCALPVAKVEHLVLIAIDVDCHIASDDR